MNPLNGPQPWNQLGTMRQELAKIHHPTKERPEMEVLVEWTIADELGKCLPSLAEIRRMVAEEVADHFRQEKIDQNLSLEFTG